MGYSSKIHISYGLGGFLDNFFTAAFAVRVIGFFETEIKLDIQLISLAFIIYGVWNMFNDPIAGFLSDRKTRFTKRWGRRFPWFVVSAIPYTVVYLFIFTVPNTETLSAFFWLLFIICLFDVFYSFWMTNWLAIFPDKFRSNRERTKVGGLSTIFGQLGIAFGMLLPPLFITYGNINSYMISAMVVLIIGIFCALAMIPGMQEDQELRERTLRIIDETKDRSSFFQTLKFAMRQKNFVVYVFVYLSQMVLFMLMLGSVYYWVRYILEEEAAVEIFISGAFLVGSIVSVPLWMKLGRKYGNRKVYLIGSGLTALLFLPMLFIWGLEATVIGTTFLGVTLGSLWTLMYPTFSDVIDEIVVKTGTRKEGVYTGIRTFFGRLSNIIGAIVIAGIHIITGFIPDAETQTPFALWGIRVIMALVPMLFYSISFLLVWKFYDLNLEKVRGIQIKLKEMNL